MTVRAGGPQRQVRRSLTAIEESHQSNEEVTELADLGALFVPTDLHKGHGEGRGGNVCGSAESLFALIFCSHSLTLTRSLAVRSSSINHERICDPKTPSAVVSARMLHRRLSPVSAS